MPRGPGGQVQDEQPRDRNFIDLSDEAVAEDDFCPPPVPVPGSPRSDLSYAPTTPVESQPENEESPSEPIPDTTEVPMEADASAIPVPSDDEDLVVEEVHFGDDCSWETSVNGVWELELTDCEYETNMVELMCQSPEVFEEIFLATSDRKQRIELNYRSLSSHDQKLFDAAKNKEVKAWIDHGTVKRLTKGTLKPEQIMRCRWI